VKRSDGSFGDFAKAIAWTAREIGICKEVQYAEISHGHVAGSKKIEQLTGVRFVY
jgi:hypothetical protein